jgi:hypothetical protein
MNHRILIGLFVFAAALPAIAAPRPAYTPEQEKLLVIRVAHADGYVRLADAILAAHLADDKTVASAITPAGDAEVALRTFLRSARLIGDPRIYSDGVAEVDLEISLESVVQKVGQLCGAAAAGPAALADLRSQAVDGFLRVSGRGRVPPDLMPGILAKVEAAKQDEPVEMFPAGWERVTGCGRIEAERRARVAAYAAMGDLIRGIQVSPTARAGELVAGSSAAEAALDVFIRGLPVTGPPRLMPDGIAEVDVAAAVRDLIKVLKDVRALAPGDPRWSDDAIDQLSVRLKTDRLVVTGHGMPSPEDVRPAESLAGPPAAPPPDWATEVLEARGVARLPDDVQDPAEARLLAARSAKVRAAADLARQLDALKLDDGRTVRDRAAKDDAFRRDLTTLLASARIVKYQPMEGGKQWEAVLRLPLMRLWEFSRPKE